MKEIRKIKSESVQALCIKERYYTKGNNQEYDNLLTNLCDWDKDINIDALEEIANNILNHSDYENKMQLYGCTFYEVKTNLMHCLVKDCCISFFE